MSTISVKPTVSTRQAKILTALRAGQTFREIAETLNTTRIRIEKSIYKLSRRGLTSFGLDGKRWIAKRNTYRIIANPKTLAAEYARIGNAQRA